MADNKYIDKELLYAPNEDLTPEQLNKKKELWDTPDVAPLKINRHNPTFRKKMERLSQGLAQNNDHKIQEIVEYFKHYNILVEYNESLRQIKLVAQGAIPLYFNVQEFLQG